MDLDKELLKQDLQHSIALAEFALGVPSGEVVQCTGYKHQQSTTRHKM